MSSIPYSAAADRNKEAIANALVSYLERATNVLEIGSGSGQHALFFCERFNHLQWQVTEQRQYLDGLIAAVENAACANIDDPFELDVNTFKSNSKYSLIYSANTAHIMSIGEVEAMFTVVANGLQPTGDFALYGPFQENGRFDGDNRGEGNRAFDASLQAQDPRMGIRDLAEIKTFATAAGLALKQQINMPANNRILLFAPVSDKSSE